ncbi:MAG: PIN domain-containing protein [Acidobacteria bacterium]|nr:PIN domain-containing protein [Acidobacteriota bacterium]
MTGESSIFLDSNIWIYALSTEDDEKARNARQLIEEFGSRISFTTQIVNEVCINLKRKSSMSEQDIRTLVESFYLNYQAIEIKETILVFASELRERHAFSFWDSIVAASALAGGAEILYSEDMQDGFILDNKLRIIDPFKV